MSDDSPAKPFDAHHAEKYDERWAPLAPLNASLHLQMQLILETLPPSARVLCVGVGTGAELLALARTFPGWHFTAVEPAAPMLDICRRKATEAGIAGRCEFHTAYLHQLPSPTEPFDAATSILVSHFITDRAKRVAFFRDIAGRLRRDGVLITADLGRWPEEPHARLIPVWQRMMRFAGATAEQVQAMLDAYKRDVAILTPDEMDALLREAGFIAPTHFSQALLLHAWFATRA